MVKKIAAIQYKTKVRQMEGRNYIDFKKAIGRTDCNLRSHEHAYYNCDMFPSMLQRATKAAQKGRAWSYLDELPEGITVDTSAFLAVVTIIIEV